MNCLLLYTFEINWTDRS